jgi:uncharacterized protein
MKWIGRRQSDYVEDQRESSTGRGRAGIGIGSLVVVGLALYALGGDPQTIISILQSQIEQSPMAYTQSSGPTSDFDSAESKTLVSVTLASLEDSWSRNFQERGAQYQPAPLVLYRGGTDTGCGFGQSATGPFYCPLDGKVYLDLGFMDDLVRLGGSGDFALAYVIAHEVGHHVQTLINPRRMRSQKSQAESIATELQADCYAGVWAFAASKELDFLEPGDLEEGLQAAAAVGDDHIQRSAGQMVSPESFSHGSSAQREEAFRMGFESGRMEACEFR